MNNIQFKPKQRSKFRIFLGVRYYRFLRFLRWHTDEHHYADTFQDDALKHTVFCHATPLYRSLKDVDMWLQDNKVHNLKIAVKTVHRVVIKPDETFSYWKLIGNPNGRKGYKRGMILHYGQFKDGVGGGLCQLSNLIFWMAMHTPLTVVERYRHSYDVFPDSNRTQPFGSGATCVYNYRDLVLRNDTHESYQINLWLDDAFLHGEIRSDAQQYFQYQVYEASHNITHEFWGAYMRHNTLRKKVMDMDGAVLHDDFVCENHALMMYEPFIEG